VKNQLVRLLLIGALIAGSGSALRSQQPATSEAALVLTQLTVQVVMTKHQGEKKVSSVPYTLSLVANAGGDPISVRMGTRVPIVTETTHGGAVATSNVEYADVGMGIDCLAWSTEDGRFRLSIAVEDNSVLAEPPAGAKSGGRPIFRTFKASQMILLRDGQSAQFTAATDKLTGEVTKLEVSLTVAK
jgi:Flp pilus assembly secretin CpaC